MTGPSNERDEQASVEAKGAAVRAAGNPTRTHAESEFYRAANEDDDGYDPYSDRPAPREPLFERDPWS
ncbi:MAG: hypothetical protein J6D34_11820 [Atopobiaceae bacterium]|nr:hypothetical protein [Atopobiaceae bacterium]